MSRLPQIDTTCLPQVREQCRTATPHWDRSNRLRLCWTAAKRIHSPKEPDRTAAMHSLQVPPAGAQWALPWDGSKPGTQRKRRRMLGESSKRGRSAALQSSSTSARPVQLVACQHCTCLREGLAPGQQNRPRLLNCRFPAHTLRMLR